MIVIDEVNMETEQGEDATVRVRHEEPTICPLCHTGIKVYPLSGHLDSQKHSFVLLYQCNACSSFFIKISFWDKVIQDTPITQCFSEANDASYLAPRDIQHKVFDKRIKQISSQFIDIYNDSSRAEQEGLSEIAGMGYRKSIEFLIKDYLISKIEDQAAVQKILSKALGNCIQQDVSNPNVKEVAEKAVWIGNDETHYIRKHTDKDINDLKQLIDVTVNWIVMDLITEEAKGISKK